VSGVPTVVPEWLLAERRSTGDRIRRLRSRRSISQERLGEGAGIDRKTVSRIETGTTPADHDQLARIANAISVPLWRLFWDE